MGTVFAFCGNVSCVIFPMFVRNRLGTQYFTVYVCIMCRVGRSVVGID